MKAQDITFCTNGDCSIKQYCHRFIGCKQHIASYSDFREVCNIDNIFKYFIQADPEDMQIFAEGEIK